LLNSQRSVQKDADHALLVPIPLSKKRERWRGYNQSLLLAQELSERWGYSVASLFLRVRHTQPQSQLSRLSRFEHVRGIYKLRPLLKRLLTTYSTIILVDDVLTTGATLQECASLLRKEGYTGIIEGCVIAIEPPVYFDED